MVHGSSVRRCSGLPVRGNSIFTAWSQYRLESPTTLLTLRFQLRICAFKLALIVHYSLRDYRWLHSVLHFWLWILLFLYCMQSCTLKGLRFRNSLNLLRTLPNFHFTPAEILKTGINRQLWTTQTIFVSNTFFALIDIRYITISY